MRRKHSLKTYKNSLKIEIQGRNIPTIIEGVAMNSGCALFLQVNMSEMWA